MYDKIILVVLIVILVIVTVLYFKADWYNKALKKIGLKSDSDVNEGYTNSMLRESKPPVEQRLKSAAYKIIEGTIQIIREVTQPSPKEIEYIRKAIGNASDEVYKEAEKYANGDYNKKNDYIQRNAIMKMTDVALKESIKLISVIGDPAYEPRLRAFIKGPVKEEANRLIIFDAKPSKLQIKNINDDKNRVKDLLMDFHFKRNKPGDWETREVDPMQRSFGRKLDVRARTSADDIIDTLASDNPALMNNNSLLPKVKDVNGSPLNLEIANTVASQRRYYDKVSDSQFRNRGGDTRPLPPALIEMVIKKGNSRDPNSLQQSVNYSVLDILESGRGHSGNEQIDKYRDQIYNTMSNPFVRDIGEFVDKTVNKTKYGSLVDDKSSERRIVSDVLFGNNSEELWQ